MTPEELFSQCQRAVETRGADAEIVLYIKGRWTQSGQKRLFGKFGPWGRCLDDATKPGFCICMFKASEIMGYLLSDAMQQLKAEATS